MRFLQNDWERIGDYLVRVGIMNRDQVDAVIIRQFDQPKKLFGEIAIEMGYIDTRPIRTYLKNLPWG